MQQRSRGQSGAKPDRGAMGTLARTYAQGMLTLSGPSSWGADSAPCLGRLHLVQSRVDSRGQRHLCNRSEDGGREPRAGSTG